MRGRGLEHYMFGTRSGYFSFFKISLNDFKSSATVYKKARQRSDFFIKVRGRGLEPPRLAAYGPEPYVSANFTTRAYLLLLSVTLNYPGFTYHSLQLTDYTHTISIIVHRYIKIVKYSLFMI